MCQLREMRHDEMVPSLRVVEAMKLFVLWSVAAVAVLALGGFQGCRERSAMDGVAVSDAGGLAVLGTKSEPQPQGLDQVPTLLILDEFASRGLPVVRAVPLTATWHAPATGSPVVYYELEIESEGDHEDYWRMVRHIAALSHPVWLPLTQDRVRARVRGVDAQGRTGEWSEWSEWHSIVEG